jgi:molybdopterin molybdotransferase
MQLMSASLPSYDEAAALIAACAAEIPPPARTERLALSAAAGRVLATPLRADRDQPAFARSTRDGYACRAAEAAAHAWLPVAGMTRAGQAPASPLAPGEAWEIMTGAPVPAGADAVMMLEHVEGDAEADRRRVRLQATRTLAAGENIVARGAEARAGDQLLAPGALIGAAQIALAAACGAASLAVYARPRVAILSTGDELVPVEAEPAPGQIRNSNAPMLAALVEAAGGEPWVLPAATDSAAALDAALDEAAAADLLLITGGVSAGKFDLVEPALLRRGARFHFTGARIQPGKPVVFGEIPDPPAGAGIAGSLVKGHDFSRAEDAHESGRALAPEGHFVRRTGRGETASALDQVRSPTICCFGLPGNPVSSAVTFLLFAAPMLAALDGRRELGPRFALARLTESVKSKAGLTRFFPAACTFGATGMAGAMPEVARIAWQGSGDVTAMARANCFLVVPEETDSLDAGALVRILLA